MKIQFKGQFDQKDFLKAVSQMFEMFNGDDRTVSGCMELNVFQDGKPLDLWSQEGDFPVEVTVHASRVPTRISEEEVQTDTVLTSLNPYEFMKGELVEVPPYAEVVGKSLNSFLELEDVLSVEKYCKANNLQIYYYKYIRSIVILMTETTVKRSELERLFIKSKPIGLTLVKGHMERIYDVVQILEENEIPYIPYKEIDLFEMGIGEVIGLTDEQLNHLEIGYTIDEGMFIGCTIKPVYLKRAAYEKNGLRFIEESELSKEKGNTLFHYQTLHMYFPGSYGVRSELEPYGWAGNGSFYHQTKQPLYEKFGLLKAEEIGEEDFLVHPRDSMKLRNLLKKSSILLDDIQPDGMTKDYQLVYRQGKIPSPVIGEFQSYLNEKQKLALKKGECLQFI